MQYEPPFRTVPNLNINDFMSTRTACSFSVDAAFALARLSSRSRNLPMRGWSGDNTRQGCGVSLFTDQWPRSNKLNRHSLLDSRLTTSQQQRRSGTALVQRTNSQTRHTRSSRFLPLQTPTEKQGSETLRENVKGELCCAAALVTATATAVLVPVATAAAHKEGRAGLLER